MSLQYLKKEVRRGVYFSLADEHQSLLQVDLNTLGIKDVYKVILSLLLRMIKHSQSTQSNKFAISQKKKLRKEFIFFHADEHQSLLFLMEVARYVQNTQSRRLALFLQRVLELFLCSIVMQNIRIFHEGPAMFIVTCFLAQLHKKISA